jgi:hypothetical protein
MLRGRQKEQWAHTAHLIVTLVNFSAVRDPKKSPVTFADVYPFAETCPAGARHDPLREEWLGLVEQQQQKGGGRDATSSTANSSIAPPSSTRSARPSVRQLSKAGAFVMRRARTSIRRRRRSRSPGSPPSSHVGLLRDWILFAYDEHSDSVVVGAKLLNAGKAALRRGGTPVPRLLETRRRGPLTAKGKPATYRKFPYMEPAWEAERPNFPDLFADSVK